MQHDLEVDSPWPNTTADLRFNDPNNASAYTDIMGGYWNTANGFPATSPFLLTRHHLAVKKDLFVKGQVVSMEGCLTLYGGYAGWITGAGGFNTWNPIVMLAMGPGSSYYDSNHPRNCLEIRTIDHGYGGLIAKNLAAWGYTNFDWSYDTWVGTYYTSSRELNTNYFNDSGRTIKVYISFNCNGAGTYGYATITGMVDNMIAAQVRSHIDTASHCMVFDVPHGKGYALNIDQSVEDFISNLVWSECPL